MCGILECELHDPLQVLSNGILKHTGAGYYLLALVGTCMGTVDTYGGIIAASFS